MRRKFTKFLLIGTAIALFTACDKNEDVTKKESSSNQTEEQKQNGSQQDDYPLPAIIQNGVIKAAFSISDTSKAYFSQGNLQYQASTNTWRFAPKQYERAGYANKKISPTYDGWIDLFGWGTSGWPTNGFENPNRAYHPYDTSRKWSNYDLGCKGGLSGMTGDYANGDWGVYNAISNGGNQPGMWRTPSKNEWMYLINSRPDAANKYGYATINLGNEERTGLVLLPDEWEQPSGVTFKSGENSDDVTTLLNNYSLDEWRKLEANGAVFLPFAGLRSKLNVDLDSPGKRGLYWSSSIYDSSKGYLLRFDLNCVNPKESNYFYRYQGMAVRLIQDVK